MKCSTAVREKRQTDVIRNRPINECVLDVITGCVDEYTVLIPGTALHSHVLMYRAQTVQLPRANSDSYNTTKWDELSLASVAQ